MAALWTVLCLVGTLGLIAWYLYKAGVKAERTKNELDTLKDKERINEQARKDHAKIDADCSSRRAVIKRWLRDNMQDR